MSRIRTVKPDFFRHELLNELEDAHPELRVMLVFSALWTQCDKQGVFPYKPKVLKLDILPFVEFDIAKSLELLVENAFIQRFEADGRQYGYIPTFHDHQRIIGEEAKQTPKYPEYNAQTRKEAGQKQEGSRSEAGQKQEGTPVPSWEREGSREEGVGEKEREEERTHGISACAREEVQEPTQEPMTFGPDAYARKILETWKTIPGVPDPGDYFRFINLHMRRILPFTAGIHSNDVIKAMQNLGEVIALGDESWWKARPGIIQFFEKHLDRFLPANFQLDDYAANREQSEFDKMLAEAKKEAELG